MPLCLVTKESNASPTYLTCLPLLVFCKKSIVSLECYNPYFLVVFEKVTSVLPVTSQKRERKNSQPSFVGNY